MARLGLLRKRLAARVAKDAWVASNGDKDAYEAAVKADERLVGIDPATIILIIRLIWAAYEWFKNRKASAEQHLETSEDDILLGSVRYYKG